MKDLIQFCNNRVHPEGQKLSPAGSLNRVTTNDMLEYHIMILRALIIATLCFAIAIPAIAATENVAADAAILKHTSNTQQLIDACSRLLSPLFVTTPIIYTAHSSPNGEAALAAMKTFVLYGHNTLARIRCARYLGNTSILSYEPAKLSKSYIPYADRANAIILALFDDRDPALRAGAAKALWGIPSVEDGHALLRQANTDPAPAVVAASFNNMFWGMKADISASHDEQAYDSAISRGLHSKDQDVIAGALTAYAGLHSINADKTLRVYALDKRPAVRLGAIAAYDTMMAYNESITDFLESRLSDPNSDVRDRVMLELMRMSDTHALPAIEQLARTAPTAAERASAAAYAKTMKKDAAANSH